MKRLYTVTVEFDYAVMAESESDAIRTADDAAGDVYLRECASATLTVQPVPTTTGHFYTNLPEWDDDSLVYGCDEDITLGDAVEAEKKRLADEQLAAKQVDLFQKDKKP